MRKRDYLISGCLFAMGLGISSGAMACATSQWDDTQGSAVAGSPVPVGTTARVEQKCGLAISGAPGYVQDNHPIDAEDARIRLRFYVLVAGGGAATTEKPILAAYQFDDATGPAFTISYRPDGTDKISFNPTGGTAVQVDAPAGWILIEIDWQAGEGLRYWVNASPNVDDNNPTGTTDAGTATRIGMVRLGAPEGLGELTKLTFDSYQANRSNPVGGLLDCDANADGKVNTLDMLGMTAERFGNPRVLQKGQPDCTRNGVVDTLDIVAAIPIAFPP